MNKALIGLATAIHLLPHPFGVSTVGATALYAGAYGGARRSWLVPFIPLTIGLGVTGLYQPLVMIAVFIGFAASTLAGRLFLARERSLQRYAVAVVTGATLFYVVSNFAVWLVYYPATAAGLLQCYVNGLPFLGRAALADAAYCFVLFGLHAAIERRLPEPAAA